MPSDRVSGLTLSPGPKQKKKEAKFVPSDTSSMRDDFDKKVKRQLKKVQDEGWWKRLTAQKPKAAIGVGCGVGVGFGIGGAAGIDAFLSLHMPTVAFGFGAGCGAGIGYGVGFGMGKKMEPWKEGPRVKRV